MSAGILVNAFKALAAPTRVGIEVIRTFIRIIKGIVGAVGSVVKAIRGGIRWIGDFAGKVATGVRDIRNKIDSFFNNLARRLAKFGRDAVAGFIDGFTHGGLVGPVGWLKG